MAVVTRPKYGRRDARDGTDGADRHRKESSENDAVPPADGGPSGPDKRSMGVKGSARRGRRGGIGSARGAVPGRRPRAWWLRSRMAAKGTSRYGQRRGCLFRWTSGLAVPDISARPSTGFASVIEERMPSPRPTHDENTVALKFCVTETCWDL